MNLASALAHSAANNTKIWHRDFDEFNYIRVIGGKLESNFLVLNDYQLLEKLLNVSNSAGFVILDDRATAGVNVPNGKPNTVAQWANQLLT